MYREAPGAPPLEWDLGHLGVPNLVYKTFYVSITWYTNSFFEGTSWGRRGRGRSGRGWERRGKSKSERFGAYEGSKESRRTPHSNAPKGTENGRCVLEISGKQS